jgi:hypothetical protein
VPERQSNNKRQLPIYQYDRDFREAQIIAPKQTPTRSERATAKSSFSAIERLVQGKMQVGDQAVGAGVESPVLDNPKWKFQTKH